MVAAKNELVFLIYPECRRRPYIYVGVVLCVLLGILIPHAMGDNGQFRTRDNFKSEIKSKYVPIHKAKMIETRSDAEAYLRHYGYLNCTEDQARKKRQLIPEGLKEGGDRLELDPCEDTHYVKALKKFQLKRNLTVTGVLDIATKEKMMEGRCGDPDPIDLNDNDEMKNSESPESNRNAWKNSNGPMKRSKRDVTVTQENSSHFKLWDLLSPFKSLFGRYSGGDVENRGGFGIFNLFSSPDSKDLHISVHWHTVPEGKSEPSGPKSLLSMILQPHKRKKPSRRREMLNDIKKTIKRNIRTRREAVDKDTFKGKYIINPLFPRSRRKRDQSYNNETETENDVNHMWNKRRVLTYRVLKNGFSSKIPLSDQCATVALAFRMWAEVTNLDFIPSPRHHAIEDANILLAFGRGEHYDCDKKFDGLGGEIAHSNTRGGHSSFHIDEAEEFKAYPRDRDDGISLLLTLLHETGHVLGLSHSFHHGSIMSPTLSPEIYSPEFELTQHDRLEAQTIYGKCTGRFSGVFDWLHTNPNVDGGLNCMKPCTCDIQYWQYYSYFFRDDIYWLYLNSEQRPRYGDPLSIKLKWRNLPKTIDSVVQTTKELKNVCGSRTQFELVTYFFAGEKYYIYDDIEDEVMNEGYISEKFGPLANQTTTIPSHLDAVLFDPRDKRLYFFKDDWVGVVDPFLDSNGSCCEKQYTFSDYYSFNASEHSGNETVPELNGYVDTVYLRYSERAIYFFKNEHVYKADISPITQTGSLWRDKGPLKLTYEGKWNEVWNYLCDVHNSADYCSVSDLYRRDG